MLITLFKKEKIMKKILTTLLLTTLTTFAINVGEVPKDVTLEGDNGGLVDGSAWSSSTLKDKVHVLFYVDPDKKGDNEAFIDALHAKNYDREKYGSVAIINLKATWLPNFAIEKKLKAKQEQFPQTIYAKDKTKYLVTEWELADDASNILVFGKDGRLLYSHTGAIEGEEMEKVFSVIDVNLDK
jgi:predicted transcriptional regulator